MCIFKMLFLARINHNFGMEASIKQNRIQAIHKFSAITIINKKIEINTSMTLYNDIVSQIVPRTNPIGAESTH